MYYYLHQIILKGEIWKAKMSQVKRSRKHGIVQGEKIIEQNRLLVALYKQAIYKNKLQTHGINITANRVYSSNIKIKL